MTTRELEQEHQKQEQEAYNDEFATHKKKVNHVVAIVLSVLVGALGVDRFYTGRLGLGLGKLFSQITIVGGLVWWLVDVILVAMRRNRLGQDYYWDDEE